MSEFKKMRAAGYARVSTEEEIQEGSYDLQVQYFRDMIMEDPNLELVGVYGDFGISGREAEKRPGLQQMLKDCDDGKIDVIYTKSVSRFARNIADMVEIVTHLRKIGIAIYFEEQGLNTMDRSSDLLVNILGIIAEEESRSIGENVRLGLQVRCATGHPVGRVAYGYRRINKNADWRSRKKRQSASGLCSAWRQPVSATRTSGKHSTRWKRKLGPALPGIRSGSAEPSTMWFTKETFRREKPTPSMRKRR